MNKIIIDRPLNKCFINFITLNCWTTMACSRRQRANLFSWTSGSLKYCQVAGISLGLPKWVPFLSGSWLRINRPTRVPGDSWLKGIKGGRCAALILLSSICNHPESCHAASYRYFAVIMPCYIRFKFNISHELSKSTRFTPSDVYIAKHTIFEKMYLYLELKNDDYTCYIIMYKF